MEILRNYDIEIFSSSKPLLKIISLFKNSFEHFFNNGMRVIVKKRICIPLNVISNG